MLPWNDHIDEFRFCGLSTQKPQNLNLGDIYLMSKNNKELSKLASEQIVYDTILILGNTNANVDTKVQAILQFIKVFNDDLQTIRSRSSSSLALVFKPVLVPLLNCLNNSESQLRAEAATALGLVGDLDVIEPLITMLNDEDHLVRLSIQTSLAGMGKPALATLYKALKSKSIEVRSGAAHAIGIIGEEESIEALAVLVEDESPEVRASVVGALGTIAKPRVLEPIMRVIQDPDAWVRFLVYRVLGELGNERHLPALEWAIQNDKAFTDKGDNKDWALDAIEQIRQRINI
jgi:HEAT repeat protein